MKIICSVYVIVEFDFSFLISCFLFECILISEDDDIYNNEMFVMIIILYFLIFG